VKEDYQKLQTENKLLQEWIGNSIQRNAQAKPRWRRWTQQGVWVLSMILWKYSSGEFAVNIRCPNELASSVVAGTFCAAQVSW